MSIISTPITELFGIKHPVLLAGMNVAAGPELAAAVTNAGGLGVIGGFGYTPKILRQQVRLFGQAFAFDFVFDVDIVV
jgi:NAD(P)H-dependent flavin oxidoreductase YrpB (nitropropane dioxygenase family)